MSKSFQQNVWQVSPTIDLLSYHFSWLFVFVPMLLTGMPGKVAPLSAAIFIFVVVINFFHRHVTLVYAFLDPLVFQAYKKKIVIGSIAIFCFFILHMFFIRQHMYFYIAFIGIASFALLWNFWHVLMQKYGIFRMYAVKSMEQNRGITPAFVDRLFILCWIPLFIFYLCPKYQQLIFENGKTVAPFFIPIFQKLEAIQNITLPISIFVIFMAVFLFLYMEFKIAKTLLSPRAIYGINLICLYLAFVFLDPLQAYVAFGFNHAFEYLVFVGAFWKKKSFVKDSTQNYFFIKIAKNPFLFLCVFFVLLGGGYFALRYWGTLFQQEKGVLFLFGFTTSQWLFYWSVYESMLHFHMDGYLWKMKKTEVTKYI